jgi:hypothetical protein
VSRALGWPRWTPRATPDCTGAGCEEEKAARGGGAHLGSGEPPRGRVGQRGRGEVGRQRGGEEEKQGPSARPHRSAWARRARALQLGASGAGGWA